MSIRRLFALILLFLFFEIVVCVLARLLLPNENVYLVCTIMTALAIAVWAAFVLLTRFLTRPRIPAAAPARSPVPGPVAAAARDDESSTLVALLREAEERLRNASTLAQKGIQPTARNLPLYLLLGPDGAGKTSALVNSGLEPQLLAGESHRDAGLVPTKVCNLWFASESLFADFSGRFFDQDAGRWAPLLRILSGRREESFLRKLVRRENHRQDIRVVLFCEASPFLASADPERGAVLARRVQQALEVVSEVYRIPFPVYVIFTKCDSIPHFQDFFSRLNDEEDRLTLGCTLPLEAREAGGAYLEAERKRLSSYFNALCVCLAAKRTRLLAREGNPLKRSSVYEFPRELKRRLRGPLVEFLVDAFRPNPLQPGPWLRGFYFAGVRLAPVSGEVEATTRLPGLSGTPEATGFFNPSTQVLRRAELQQKLASAEAEQRGSPRTRSVQRWAFLYELWREIIVPDRSARPAAVLDRRLETCRRAVYASSGLLCMLVTGLLFISWYHNRQLLEEVEPAAVSAATVHVGPETPADESLERLDALRSELEMLIRYDRVHPPFALRGGLYSGNRILPVMREVYFRKFRELILDDVLESLRDSFESLPGAPESADAYAAVYQRLRAYLMITSGECTFDGGLLTGVINDTWTSTHAAQGSSTSALVARQIGFYADQLEHDEIYRHLLEAAPEAASPARRYLQAFQGADPQFASLLAQADQAARQPLRLADFAPDYAVVLSGPGEVRGAFTRGGWDAAVELSKHPQVSAIDACVLGESRTSAWLGRAGSQLRDRYINAYIAAWKQFLAAENIKPFRDRSDAALKLNLLSDPRSPLLALLFLVSENTDLQSSSSAVQRVEKGFVTRIRNFLGSQDQPSRRVLAEVGSALTAEDVSKEFQPVHLIVDPRNPERWIWDANRKYAAALAGLHDALQMLAQSSDSNPDLSLYEQARKAVNQAWESARELEDKFDHTPQGIDIEVKRLLEQPIVQADRLLPRSSNEVVVKQLNGAAAALCGKFGRLRRKYPFNPRSDEEVSLEEFSNFFKPGGTLWVFSQQPPLSNFILRIGGQWVQNPAAPQPQLSPKFLAGFRRMTAVSDLLFPADADQPRLQYTLTPSATSNIQSLLLQVDGKRLAYRPGQTPTGLQLVWPAPPGLAEAKLHITSGMTAPLANYPGSWGIFRMMENNDHYMAGTGIFEFSNIRQGRSAPLPAEDASGRPIAVRIQVELPAGRNPFEPGFFSTIGCASQVTQ